MRDGLKSVSEGRKCAPFTEKDNLGGKMCEKAGDCLEKESMMSTFQGLSLRQGTTDAKPYCSN